MSPSDILAAARQNVVGPYLLAREGWLRGWVGPCSPGNCDDSDVAICDGQIVDDRWVGAPNGIRLDVNRPEVRDHLVRLGCPEWGRDVPAAVWAWGMGVEVFGVLPMWRRVDHPAKPMERFADLDNRSEAYRGGWTVRADGRNLARSSLDNTAGKEAAELCDECDLAALNANCIIREPGGWLVPLPMAEAVEERSCFTCANDWSAGRPPFHYCNCTTDGVRAYMADSGAETSPDGLPTDLRLTRPGWAPKEPT